MDGLTALLRNDPRRRAFVVGAYVPRGGTYMAYHLGRILHTEFGFLGLAVGSELPPTHLFDYDPAFPVVSAEMMEDLVTDDDVIIANPSFSYLHLGLRLPGVKLMYIQGFSTYQLLDGRFDCYVSVSGFVRYFVHATYGIATEVVPPFLPPVPASTDWHARPPASMLISTKGNDALGSLLLTRILDRLATHGLTVHIAHIGDAPLSRRELLARMGRNRYFLSLVPHEGFGLMPLEAMAMGCTVLGFDGGGGRDYLRDGENCAVVGYPDIDGLIEKVVSVFEDPLLAASLALAGKRMATAGPYTYEHFRDSWRTIFSNRLNLVPTAE